MNVALSSRHSVHATRENSTGPACHAFGAPHGSESYRPTTREVTCRKCIKFLAEEAKKEADYQDRLAASLAPATESHDLGYVHADEQAAADEQPEEIKAAREEAEAKATGARYAAQLLAGKADAAPVVRPATATPCCDHAGMYHGGRGCDQCGCTTPRDQMQSINGVAYRPWGTDVLPPSVTMDPVTRVLSGQARDMLDLYQRGLAVLDDAGDLILC